MRSAVLSILLFFLSASCFAKCGSNGIGVVGDNRMIYDRSVIILEFYMNSQQVAHKLNVRYPAYLQSGKEKIPLKVIQTLTGGYNITQVILLLTIKPAEGKRYSLEIDHLKKEDGEVTYFDIAAKKMMPYMFTGSAAPANTPLLFSGLPVETKKTMVSYGCGPAQWIYYSLPNKTALSAYVLASLKDKNNGLTTEFIVASDKEGTIMIGHGMCTGGFNFTEGHQYEISFAPMDLSGYKGPFTSTMTVSPPFSDTGNEE
ncbi:MAG: hypothetical protein NTW29_21570 [Bacteroidetes bacterium]|nr:hypothetical protein [Bacteroidota bacterium]